MTVQYLLDRYYSSLALNKMGGLLSPWVVQEYPHCLNRAQRYWGYLCFCLDWGFSLVNRLSKVLVPAETLAQWWPIDQARDVLWLDKLILPMSPCWAPPSTQTRRECDMCGNVFDKEWGRVNTYACTEDRNPHRSHNTCALRDAQVLVRIFI